MKKHIVLAIIAAIIPGLAKAQSLQSLEIPVDPASTAMGGATLAADAGAYSTRLNPASMSFYDLTMASGVSYGKWAPSTLENSTISAGGFVKLGSLAVGLDFSRITSMPYNTTTEQGTAGKEFTPADNTVGLGLSYLVGDNLSIGATARYTSSALSAKFSGSAVSADLSVLWKNDGLKAGAMLKNVGSKISYGADAYSLPMIASVGGSYSLSAVTCLAQLDYHVVSGGVTAEVGAQYSFNDMLFARAGLHYGDKAKTTPTFFSFGLGAHFSGIGVDFSYMIGDAAISNSLLAGLVFAF